MELHMTAKISSGKLFLGIENLNQSILNDVLNKHYDKSKPVDPQQLELVPILSFFYSTIFAGKRTFVRDFKAPQLCWLI